MVDCELLERQFDRARTSTDEPVARREVVLPHDHAQPAPQPVPDHRRRRPAVRWRRPRGRGRLAGRSVEIGTPQGLAAEPRRRHDRGGRRRHDLESNRSSRQTGATLGATSLEHGPAAAGAHAGAEAVRLGTTTGVWLKGTLHGDLRLLGRHSTRRPAWTGLTWDASADSTLPGYGERRRTPNQAVQTTPM